MWTLLAKKILTGGTIVTYRPKFFKQYIGSPTLCKLKSGVIIVAHDVFGPNSDEFSSPKTFIYQSNDNGLSWTRISVVMGAFWSRLFFHNNTLYLLGTDAHHGNLVIRKSEDSGVTWSTPHDKTTGVLRSGMFHCAPTPVAVLQDKLYFSIEFADGHIKEWGKRYGASLFSIPVGDDFLRAENWQHTKPVYYQPGLLGGGFGGWLEGNAVIGQNQLIHNILRVENDSTYEERVAVFTHDVDQNEIYFDINKDFVPFPGGSKKFSILFDSKTRLYLSLTNSIADTIPNSYPGIQPDAVRNKVSLVTSKDLRNWRLGATILETDDVLKTAYQYISWDFDNEDIIFVSRTAHSDFFGGAHTAHDANYLTFHRIPNFRDLI